MASYALSSSCPLWSRAVGDVSGESEAGGNYMWSRNGRPPCFNFMGRWSKLSPYFCETQVLHSSRIADECEMTDLYYFQLRFEKF